MKQSLCVFHMQSDAPALMHVCVYVCMHVRVCLIQISAQRQTKLGKNIWIENVYMWCRPWIPLAECQIPGLKDGKNVLPVYESHPHSTTIRILRLTSN